MRIAEKLHSASVKSVLQPKEMITSVKKMHFLVYHCEKL